MGPSLEAFPGRVLRAGAALLLAGAGTSCITGTYTTLDAYRRPTDPVLLEVHGGDVDLARCLELLGAPLVVLEEGSRAVLAWGWRDADGWNVSLSAPVSDQVNANLSYTDQVDSLLGLVAIFDRQWRVVEVREGRLSDLLAERQVRPQSVEVIRMRAPALQE